MWSCNLEAEIVDYGIALAIKTKTFFSKKESLLIKFASAVNLIFYSLTPRVILTRWSQVKIQCTI